MFGKLGLAAAIAGALLLAAPLGASAAALPQASGAAKSVTTGKVTLTHGKHYRKWRKHRRHARRHYRYRYYQPYSYGYYGNPSYYSYRPYRYRHYRRHHRPHFGIYLSF